MIKFFYVTGDSFAFGDELSESGAKPTAQTLYIFDEYKRRNCYTGLICDRLNISNYKNTACPGGSNERAYRMLTKDIPEALKLYKPEEIFVNISLTQDTRREFCMSNIQRPFDMGDDYYIHLSGFEPPRVNDNYRLWEVLTKYFDHPRGNVTFDIMMVLGIQNFLRYNKIPYLLTSSMGNYYEYSVEKEYISQSLVNQFCPKRCLRTPSFMRFVKDRNYPIATGLHPLEEGHIAWADFLQTYIQEHDLMNNKDL